MVATQITWGLSPSKTAGARRIIALAMKLERGDDCPEARVMLPSQRMIPCRRCGGRLYLENDVFGTFLACIQCGAVHADSAGDNLKSAATRPGPKAEREKLSVATGR